MSTRTATDLATRVRVASTLLFVPADRPERFAKAAAANPGLVVLDLEDAVAPDAKPAARAHAVAWIEAGNDCAVRVNAVGTAWHEDDLAALAPLRCAIVLPKAEIGVLDRIVDAVTEARASSPYRPKAGGSGPLLVALIETAAGVLHSAAIAARAGVDRLAIGTFDLAAELGVDPTDREALAGARHALVLASAAAGLPGPVDGVTGVVDDADLVADDARYGRRLGFTGKLCIHPRQLDPVATALRPTAAEQAWARKIFAAITDDSGVAVVDGAMVDKPVLDRARRILAQLDTTTDSEELP
ncbi:CoA ester lyase [Nocardia neocaledoniensis NBRC 108232]|uniref:Citrate lyase subunit beta/citryl-CoA lyase n=1 Tax=Nocardia neocaledoniensis TaxID=236511 RepID=A0A317N2Y4_9NOCA|nr:CoA ester lyase [Nocardia neocaledoniensis]PWV68954.1 citrate lyase subunit beta/citryl-CoA lyase [Nocardia neocaledoniensis]GEM29594.1 CoA ester lyase [Nocardia neocaledoniensis NBRC 108232]